MKRAILAGTALGLVAGLLFVYHDALELTVAWPAVLGLALWGAVGRSGSRGVMVALAAAIGVAAGYATYGVVAEYLPVTDLWVGISAGVAVGLLAVVGMWTRHRLPMSAMLVGFAAFAGLFEPLWSESPARLRTHGIETLTVSLLGLLMGVLAVTLVRSVSERSEEMEMEMDEGPERKEPAEMRGAPMPGPYVAKGGAS